MIRQDDQLSNVTKDLDSINQSSFLAGILLLQNLNVGFIWFVTAHIIFLTELWSDNKI